MQHEIHGTFGTHLRSQVTPSPDVCDVTQRVTPCKCRFIEMVILPDLQIDRRGQRWLPARYRIENGIFPSSDNFINGLAQRAEHHVHSFDH
jgi:hypothetical protein